MLTSTANEFTQTELATLIPLIKTGNKLVVYQHLFGSNIKADSDYTYKQPKVKKWVNSTLCNKI
jgi:hypothetical protein